MERLAYFVRMIVITLQALLRMCQSINHTHRYGGCGRVCVSQLITHVSRSLTQAVSFAFKLTGLNAFVWSGLSVN